MKKKILIPILGLFTFALLFSFSNNTTSNNDEIISLFIDSDNIAYAEGSGCLYPKQNYYCIDGNTVVYNMAWRAKC